MPFFFFCCFLLFSSCTGASLHHLTDSIFPLTREKIQKLSKESLINHSETLKEETISGCAFIPAKNFFQRIFVGLRSAGESCSITVHSNNKVSINFLNQKNIQLLNTSQPDALTDTFVAEINRNQVLIVQHRHRQVVSITQTIYDSQGVVVYQDYGKGEFIKTCLFDVPTGPCQ